MINKKTKFLPNAGALLVALMIFCSSALAYTTASVSADTNCAPIAENMEISTYRNIAASGRLAAVDPEGDPVTFQITVQPKKGEVEINASGGYTYTPQDNKKGRDTFKYVAVDTWGNKSNEATVTVNIQKKTTATSYADMEGNSAYYAALRLSEEGIFTGETLAGQCFFDPERTVTRGEFLAMCMKVAGIENISGVTRTGFYDDDDIENWLKPYVSTALVAGIVKGGTDTEGNHVFRANEPITFAQASVIVDSVLNITDVAATSAFPDGEAPWWYQATVNLTACNILPQQHMGSSSTLTRADAAELLLAAMEFQENR